MRRFVAAAVMALVFIVAVFTIRPGESDRIAITDTDKPYDVRILRDTWGVPHVFGHTDADVAYGLAFANAEDDFGTIQDSLLAARGQLASVYGWEEAPIDYAVHLLRIWDVVNAKYETDLSPETRAICEAYAAGLMRYAKLHPKEVAPGILPFTGKDVIARVRGLLLFFLERPLVELYAEKPAQRVVTPPSSQALLWNPAPDAVTGSNAFAVAPTRSADGRTRLAVNSHQPWTGLDTWYEAHLHSDEGWDMVGGVYPGFPMILHGHNRNLGWAHTNNRPDLVDVYVLDINPKNPYQYMFDGKWRDLEVRTAPIKVKLFGPVSWTFKKEVLWSVYGPVVRRPHGTYAIRYAGFGNIRQVEQWYRMNKARTFEEWQDSMRIQAIPLFNCVYADRKGNIYYLYNARLPIRAEGYDWSGNLPGNTSKTLWTEYLPFDKLPQIKNPASGFIQNCNSSPFQTTIGSDNPRPEDFSSAFGIDTQMTNRSLRAHELLGADNSITEDEFYKYKFDVAYSTKSQLAQVVQKILNAPPSDDPVVREAVEVLKAWDLRTNPENTNAAIGVLTALLIMRARFRGTKPPELMASFSQAAHILKSTYGRIDVEWSQVNRLRRGKLDIGLGGGPDVLRAVSGELKDGHVVGDSGDCYVLMVTFDKEGVRSRSIHQFGSATLNQKSSHYADQSPLFAKCEMKPVWFDESDIRAHLEREYKP